MAQEYLKKWKEMKKRVHFYCELYKQNFYFLQSTDINVCQEYSIDEIEEDGQHGLCFEIESGEDEGIIIWLKYKGHKGVSQLVHECVHAAHFVFKSRGVKWTGENDENLAYYVQWLFENCYKTMFRGKSDSTK